MYVGTDDGMVQVSPDGGKNWTAISKFGELDIPEYGYINDIEADLHDANTVYIAVNNHKRGDFKPYIAKSTDRGATWTNITGNLPERGSVYTIKQDHVNPDLLFCGTEFGCFFTVDGGKKWVELGAGLPTVAIRDIEIQRDENDLVLASFGRGFYILDNYTPLREMPVEGIEENKIFPVKKGQMFPKVAPLAVGQRAFQGANFYTGANPDYGVTFTYHLKDGLKTKRSERKANDKKLSAAGKDSPYPSWDDLKAEDREVAPRVELTVRDAEQKVVKRLPASTAKGLHRKAWDFTIQGGIMAPPGAYSVDLVQVVEGQTTQLVKPVSFEIEPLTFSETSPPNQVAIVEFAKRARDLADTISATSAVLAKSQEQLDAIEKVVAANPQLDPALLNDVRALELKLMDINEAFNGDPTKSRRSESAYPGFRSRLRTMTSGAMGSTEGPTDTHRQQYEIIVAEYQGVAEQVSQLLDVDLPALNAKLDAAGAPWTPGRKIPDIK